jgi:hypothetical protein
MQQKAHSISNDTPKIFNWWHIDKAFVNMSSESRRYTTDRSDASEKKA